MAAAAPAAVSAAPALPPAPPQWACAAPRPGRWPRRGDLLCPGMPTERAVFVGLFNKPGNVGLGRSGVQHLAPTTDRIEQPTEYCVPEGQEHRLLFTHLITLPPEVSFRKQKKRKLHDGCASAAARPARRARSPARRGRGLSPASPRCGGAILQHRAIRRPGFAAAAMTPAAPTPAAAAAAAAPAAAHAAGGAAPAVARTPAPTAARGAAPRRWSRKRSLAASAPPPRRCVTAAAQRAPPVVPGATASGTPRRFYEDPPAPVEESPEV
eukprot:TRINITY_DN9225_c0_g1_i1.p3 TRINITY_DN9225_c0_g1~~TRINITY_DN9225_c0_g1_i1.p3  ORF type:complete len:268 (+),score=24.85 TRINITY_DN9225_c0_g1_i1:62-865(+)